MRKNSLRYDLFMPTVIGVGTVVNVVIAKVFDPSSQVLFLVVCAVGVVMSTAAEPLLYRPRRKRERRR